jgi:hypothetical protein
LDILRTDVQKQIIKNCEKHDLIKTYNDLNKNFEKRVKVEKGEADEVNDNEKRITKSPLQKE